MKFCKDCANVRDSGPSYDCTAAATYDLVTGHKSLPRAIDARRDPGLCGLDGTWFAEKVEAVEPAVEPKEPKPEGPQNVLAASPERTIIQKLKDLFA